MTSIVMFNRTECPVKYRYKTLDKMNVAVQENTYIYILTLYVCLLYYMQKTTLKIGSAIYKLMGIEKYQNSHHSSCMCST